MTLTLAFTEGVLLVDSAPSNNNIDVNKIRAVDGAWNFEGQAITNVKIVKRIA